MKRKLFATFSALIAVFCCAFGLTACGEKTPEEQLSPLEKAYQSFLQTQNMTVTVTDTRAETYYHEYLAVVEIDHPHNAARTLHSGFEHYYEFNDNDETLEFIMYAYSDTINEDGTIGESWEKIVRDDFYEEVAQDYTLSEYKLRFLNHWVSDYLPTHMLRDASFRENKNDELQYSSLEWMLNLFTESENGYSANVYFCVYDTDSKLVILPCVATYKLDGQGRFESIVLDLGESGEIKAEFTYGTTTVIIPDKVKNGK